MIYIYIHSTDEEPLFLSWRMHVVDSTTFLVNAWCEATLTTPSVVQLSHASFKIRSEEVCYRFKCFELLLKNIFCGHSEKVLVQIPAESFLCGFCLLY